MYCQSSLCRYTQEHLVQATEARSYVKSQVDKAKLEIKDTSLESPINRCQPSTLYQGDHHALLIPAGLSIVILQKSYSHFS